LIERFLGTPKIDLTIPSLTGLGDRDVADAGDLEYEVGSARIWGGIHYRSAVEADIEIGKRTANQVLAHHLHRRESPERQRLARAALCRPREFPLVARQSPASYLNEMPRRTR